MSGKVEIQYKVVVPVRRPGLLDLINILVCIHDMKSIFDGETECQTGVAALGCGLSEVA